MEQLSHDSNERLAAEQAELLIAQLEPALRTAYPEKADRILPRERAFAEKILGFCAEAAKRGPGIVFWDQDFALGCGDESSRGSFFPRPIAKPLVDRLKELFPELAQRVLTTHRLRMPETDMSAAPPLSRTPAWDGFDLLDDVVPYSEDGELTGGLEPLEEGFLERARQVAREKELPLNFADLGKLLYAYRCERSFPNRTSYFIASTSLPDVVGEPRGLRIERSEGIPSWRDAVIKWRKEHQEGIPVRIAVSWWVDRLRAYNEKPDVLMSGPWSEDILERFGVFLEKSIKESLRTKGEVVLSVDRQADDLLRDAAIAAGFNPLYRFPNKTTMWVSYERVLARGGYGAPASELYP